MPALRLEQLDGHLARELRSLYAIHGDEPLLSLEAADAIRRKGREQGFSERVVLAADRSFDWSELAASAASLSLFGERKLIELRIASGKPGADGARAIETFCGKLPPDALTVVMLPRLDRAGQSSPWFQALESGGVVVNVFPVDRPRLPEWIAARLARQKQSAKPETLRFLADCVEGNLLAAHQEIQKLSLLLPAGELDFDAVREAVMNVARYDAGKAPPRVLWLLSEEIRAVCRVQDGLSAGRSLTDVCREARVWGDARQAAVGKAAKKFSRAALLSALEHAAAVDRMIKGIVKGDAWDELLQLGLRFAA